MCPPKFIVDTIIPRNDNAIQRGSAGCLRIMGQSIAERPCFKAGNKLLLEMGALTSPQPNTAMSRSPGSCRGVAALTSGCMWSIRPCCTEEERRMNNVLSAQPECSLSETPPAGAAILAAFLSAPAKALPPAQLKPAFFLPDHTAGRYG
ncbi:Uncharacterised protein [Iodobacter fluviatilis]|uniref:Uncharacterized protein n=3 Tax=Iodobacter fluviatilis TaxID=537 RepID=A0A377SUT6_9NEIS|nr:Uncharacterised protein [Iodobacter fluviatilis]